MHIYFIVCQPVEEGTDPNSSGWIMTRMTYLYFINKYLELADTFFFIARKKFNQVTTLHVYHHAIMPLYSYGHIRWLPGGHEILCGVLNTAVHILMYLYYLLAGIGPSMQPYLWWKKYVTSIQLIQFVFCFFHSIIVAFGVVECGYPWQVSLISMILLHVPFFYMFAQFYIKSYINRKPATNGAVTNGHSKKEH